MWIRIRPIGADSCAREEGCCAITPEQAESRGMIWVVGAFLICPCHLPLTLALVAVLFSGTAAGALLQEHPYAAGSFVTAAWLAATLRGVLYFRSARH